MTASEAYEPAMSITTQAEADVWLKKITDAVMLNPEYAGRKRSEVESIQRSNLAYFAGYYDAATRARVERLFKCAHPLFGPIATKGEPTPAQAFKLGMKLAKRKSR